MLQKLRWRNRGSRPQPELKSDFASPFTALLERCGKEAREIGWARLSPAEQEERMAAVIRAGRAELVLLEQERHGLPGPDPEELETALKELLRRRALIATQIEAPRKSEEPIPWRFHPHRAAVLATLACLAILLAATFTAWPLWTSTGLAVLGALLLTLGPWPLSAPVRRSAVLWSGAAAWLRERWRAYRLERELDRLEDEILAAGMRRAQAANWVEDRLALVRERCEVQRARAELAANITAARQQHEPEPLAMQPVLTARRGA